MATIEGIDVEVNADAVVVTAVMAPAHRLPNRAWPWTGVVCGKMPRLQ